MQSMLEDALGASGAGVREIARDMNRAAGARLLDAMGRGQLREILEESVDRVMRMPECVSDRRKLRGRKNLQILSLGAGVQSSCMALMAEHGHEGFEKPNCAIFADTGWEPAAVYRHLDWLENELSYPVYRVSAGNIRDDLLEGHTPTGKNFISIPVYTVSPDGKPGLSKRQCTSEYKLKPIFDKIRKLLEITPGKRAAKDQHADVWIGITTDEVQRMKPSREEYITKPTPLHREGNQPAATRGLVRPEPPGTGATAERLHRMPLPKQRGVEASPEPRPQRVRGRRLRGRRTPTDADAQ